MSASQGREIKGGPRARDEVLRRVGAALAERPAAERAGGPSEAVHGRPPEAPAPVVRAYRRQARPGTDAVALFAETAADYKATVERVAAGALPAALAAAVRGRGARRLVVPPGLPAAWLSELAGVELVGDEPPLGALELDALDGVVSGCAVAIAETGTIMLDGGPGQGRRALTLLPDFHLCVVEAAQVVATLAEALERLDPRRPQTWISGPSATSDIELDRVEGVHGPRTLHVLVLGEVQAARRPSS